MSPFFKLQAWNCVKFSSFIILWKLLTLHTGFAVTSFNYHSKCWREASFLMISGAYTYMSARYSLYSYIFSCCIPILQCCTTSMRADVLQCPCQNRKKLLPVHVMYAQMFPWMLHSSCVLLITFAVGKNVAPCSHCSNEGCLPEFAWLKPVQ